MRFVTGMLLVVAILMTAGPSNARRQGVAIQQHENVLIARSLSTDQVREAIISGCGKKGWVVTAGEGNNLLATLHVRGKHTIAVKVIYDRNKYSVLYHRSENMNYDPSDGGTIHPNYNRWVTELMRSISAEFAR
jgi:hypothetical protein